MNLHLQTILYATLTASMLLNNVKARGPGGEECSSNITTEININSDEFDYYIINDIIGIPDGAEVRIECDCVGPRRPPPDWRYNDIIINTTRNENDPSSAYVDNDGSHAILKINSFEEKSSGLYTCHSRDIIEYFNLTWYDPANKPQLVVQPVNLNIHVINGNETAVLQCNAFGARTYTWERKDGSAIPDKAVRREGNTILEIPNIRRGDAGDYRCIVGNDAGTSMSQYARVTVTEELIILMDPLDVNPRIGTSVTLTCGSEGFQSENFTYLWTNSSNNLVYSEASPSGTSSLVFPVVRSSDSGEYRCIVQNEWGAQVTSEPANLRVMTPASFPSINQPIGTIDEFSVILNWELSDEDADLLDSVTISSDWTSLLVYRGGTSNKRQITGNMATVTIADPTTTQYTFTDLQPFSHYCFTITALYAFEGQALGEAAAEPFCTNTSEAVPSAPQDVTVLSQGFTSLTLTWTTPQSPNGIILNYTIKYNDKVKVVAVEAVNPPVILSQLPTNTIYSIRVSATNGAGEGNYSNIITTNTLSRTATGGAIKGRLLFQIRVILEDMQSCQTRMSDSHRQLIASGISNLIRKECNCRLEEGAIDQDVLQCDHSQSNTTVFRAEIITYQLTYDDLLIIIQNMVTGGRLMLNESTIVRLDNICPVEISSFNDPLCSTAPITGNDDDDDDEDKQPPIVIIIGAIIAVVVIVVVLLVFCLLVLLYKRGKRSGKYATQDATLEVEKSTKEETEEEVTSTALYSAPLSMTEDPVQEECLVGKDGYLIPVSSKIENSINISINDVQFDDDIYLKSIQKNLAHTNEHSDVKMQANPSYHGATIPLCDSTLLNNN